jgi:D-alanine-D-alanine ligase
MSLPSPPPVPPDWWRTLFDEVYLLTDARSVQDEELTRREVDALIQTLELGPEEAVLDLCGGHGRHALELARRGFKRVAVLDFSGPLVTLGEKEAGRQGLPVAFIRADARAIPLGGGAFDAVLLLANSLGYGEELQHELEIIAEARRVLRPGGRLFLELSDPEFVRTHLPPASWHEAPGGLVVCRQRWLKGNSLTCRELVLSREGGLVRDCTYRVRLFDEEELQNLLRQAGFSRLEIRGGRHPYPSPGDYGSLSRRLAVTAWK